MKNYILMIIMLLALKANAQEPIKALKVGDKVPESFWQQEHVVFANGQAKRQTLAAYRNKVLILDFMHTACGSCIAHSPRLNALQKADEQGMAILMVTTEKEEKVRLALKKNNLFTANVLKIIVQDTLLKTYFPHQLISHLAWLDSGKLKALTTAEYVTEKNIAQFKKLPQVNWKIKTDLQLPNQSTPIIVANPLLKKSIKYDHQTYYTAITPHLLGAPAHYSKQVDSLNGVIRYRATNLSIAHLYLYLLTNPDIFPKSRIKLINDSQMNMVYQEAAGYRNVWDELHTYCFEAVLPIGLGHDQIKQKINLDLDLYFGTKGRFINQKVKSYQLQKDSADVDRTQLRSSVSNDDLKFNSMSSLTAKLNNTYLGVPFFSTIGQNAQLLVLIAPSELSEITSLTKALKAQQIRLEPIEREVEMFVLEVIKN